MCVLACGVQDVSTDLSVFIDGQLLKIQRGGENSAASEIGTDTGADGNSTGKPPRRRHRKGFAAKKIVFLLWVCIICKDGNFSFGVLETLVSPAKV